MNLPQSAAAPAPSSPHLTAVLQNKVALPFYVPELWEAFKFELWVKIMTAVAIVKKKKRLPSAFYIKLIVIKTRNNSDFNKIERSVSHVE